MIVEYAKEAIGMVRAALASTDAPLRGEGVRLRSGDQDFCPRHGSRYVVRRGTNRCPVGRKLEVN